MLVRSSLQITRYALLVYTLLISIRFIMSLLQTGLPKKVSNVFFRITDPYLNKFHGISFLRQELFDFTPLVAILVLIILHNIVLTLSYSGITRLGTVLGVVVRGAWAGGIWVLFFLILAVVRLAGLYFSRNTTHAFWRNLDLMLHPLISAVKQRFSKELKYIQSLQLTVGLLLLIWLLAGLIIRLIVWFLFRLPL